MGVPELLILNQIIIENKLINLPINQIQQYSAVLCHKTVGLCLSICV